VLGPTLYLTSDLPTLEETVVATFADDTAIMAIDDNNSESTQKLQVAITEVQRSTRKWRIKLNKTKSVHIDFTNRRIKLNETKSVHIDFTNQRVEHKPIYINHHAVPYENTAKYLGITLDTKLRSKPYVKKKQEELNLKYRKMYLLMGHYSALSIYNKLMLYQQVLKPVWTYGIQLWDCSTLGLYQPKQQKYRTTVPE
jgi:hypothetical protein